MNDAQLAARFHADMVDGYHALARSIGYRATYFLQMLNQHGGVETAHRLLRDTGTSYGFATLWQHRQLHRSVEAWVLRPDYESLFSDAERAAARAKLAAHGFNVDKHLADLSSE